MAGVEISFGITDIGPIAAEIAAKEGGLHLQHARKDILGPVTVFVVVDEIEDGRLEDVDAGIDGIGEDLAPPRLFEKLADLPFLVGDDNTELQADLSPR